MSFAGNAGPHHQQRVTALVSHVLVCAMRRVGLCLWLDGGRHPRGRVSSHSTIGHEVDRVRVLVAVRSLVAVDGVIAPSVMQDCDDPRGAGRPLSSGGRTAVLRARL
jgi:hypothetical protein